jgi:hypothetical protein
MGEEGVEANELLEQAEHHQHALEHGHAGHDDGGKKQFTMKSAITASVLAVCAALGSLLSGHSANEAILKQSQASDKWAYYQAKSTKSHIFEGSKAVVEAIASEEGKSETAGVIKSIKSFDEKIKKYERDKDEIQKEAAATEKESSELFDKHHNYSFGVACFQIGIVLASVGILVTSRFLFFGAIGAGVLGMFCLVYGFIK